MADKEDKPAERARTAQNADIATAEEPAGNRDAVAKPSSPPPPVVDPALIEPPAGIAPQPSTSLPSPDAPAPELPPAPFAQPPPMLDVPNLATERPLNVTDALSYLDSVKMQFQDSPDVYNQFLDIMKDFKSQLIDTPGVIQRVSNLFHGHPMLIQGFNTFLPAGYRIECTTDAKNPNFITVTTPMGTTTQATNGAFSLGGYSTAPAFANGADPHAPLPIDSNSPASVNVGPALSFVQRVKTRYANEPDRYKRFLEILYPNPPVPGKDVRDLEHWSVAYLSAACAQGDVVSRVAKTFQDAPELMRDFIEFLPDSQTREVELAKLAEQEEARKASAEAAEVKASKKKTETAAASSSVPQKRKRKQPEKDEKKENQKERETAAKAGPSKTKKPRQQGPASEAPSPSFTQRHVIVPASPRRTSQAVHGTPQHAHHHPVQPLPVPVPAAAAQMQAAAPQADESQFFEHVKRALDNRETYNEFLRLVNLFTQDIIDMPRLVRESRTFLGESELMEQFRRILGWDERRERERIGDAESVWTRPMAALDRPSRDQLNLRYGSYRKLPADEMNVTCSGRDEMCKSVLNDEWISQPTFASEDAGFLAHKKNAYEEALHRSEEERHEYDFHIDAIHRTIQILEPLNSKIAQLSPEDRAAFKLKPNLGGAGKAIHQRVIKKIYGREIGMEVYQAIQDTPAAAIPVVLQRLKLKHEEWKRAQREWNKVWREVDARNFHKSLDHQGITFKAADKKATTAKAFVSQIEAARDEQRAKRAALVDPLFARTRPRHQLEFVVDDVPVLQDAIKLTLSFLDRTQGQVNLADRRKIETFVRSFVPLFFVMNAQAFNSAFVPHHEIVDSDMDVDGTADDSELASVSTSARGGRGKKGAGSSSGDLRKKLLKSEQAKLSRRTRAQEVPSPSVSRMASPAASDSIRADGEETRSEHATTVNGEAVAGPSSAPITENVWQATRKRYSFFTNTTFYVLFRLLELLYSRLHLFKNIASKLINEASTSKENRVTVDVGLASRLGDRARNAVHFYGLMLELCEKLFDNEIEQHVFEDQMRYMFGSKDAYKIFTVDKLVGAIVKQIQQVLSDQKSQELYDLLRREREIPSPTTQDQINNRRNTEKIIGPDENIFRMDWLPESKTVTIQLLGKDDSGYDDSEVLTGRWQAYIDSFVSSETTEGVPAHAKHQPFLKRSRLRSPTPPPILAEGGLEIKVCVRTYRLFYVANSEDILWRVPRADVAERDALRQRLARADKRRKAWLEKLDKARDGPEKKSEAALTPSSTGAAAKADATPVNGRNESAPPKPQAEPVAAS
ncbi:hypothetical protein OBBRIDRAFT_795302 [Obba rivulosa]|uniref:Histone deacetylase interacting domain-containing protein n=1 Tax=Obba rivulosa TaxID=1052685 RepID=A0A8E2DHN4_9APHY|nr:hypothetical protein OBBRIDRAFT_795302 [Obba rivulosa]